MSVKIPSEYHRNFGLKGEIVKINFCKNSKTIKDLLNYKNIVFKLGLIELGTIFKKKCDRILLEILIFVNQISSFLNL